MAPHALTWAPTVENSPPTDTRPAPAEVVRAWPAPALLVGADGSLRACSQPAVSLLGGAPAGSLADVVGDDAASSLMTGTETRAPVGPEGRLVRATVSRLGPDQLLIALQDPLGDAEFRSHLAEAERLASVGELLSSVAHELNNPLTTVLGYAEVLLAEDDPNLPRDEIEQIRAEAARCRRIVANLLDLARTEDLDLRPLQLSQVVEKVVEFRGYAARVQQVELLVEMDEKQPGVRGDFHRLVQAAINLVTNAEQAVAGRASDRRVILRARTAGDRVRLEVEDNGPGIPAELRARVFRPFFTTKPRGKGTGLGLSLVQATAVAMGGTAHVEEGAEGGARFVLEFPVASS